MKFCCKIESKTKVFLGHVFFGPCPNGRRNEQKNVLFLLTPKWGQSHFFFELNEVSGILGNIFFFGFCKLNVMAENICRNIVTLCFNNCTMRKKKKRIFTKWTAQSNFWKKKKRLKTIVLGPKTSIWYWNKFVCFCFILPRLSDQTPIFLGRG